MSSRDRDWSNEEIAASLTLEQINDTQQIIALITAAIHGDVEEFLHIRDEVYGDVGQVDALVAFCVASIIGTSDTLHVTPENVIQVIAHNIAQIKNIREEQP